MSVRIVTSVGEVRVQLHVEEAPRASRNFLKLCKLKYYNWCFFHHVQKGFVAQTGDPSGTGTGGEALEAVLLGASPNVTRAAARFFPDEIVKGLRHDRRGLLAMANAGKDRNGSQFYITLSDRHLDYLDGKHTIFGRVVEGLDVLDRINGCFCDAAGRPLQDIYIRDTLLEHDPFPDPPLLVPPAHAPPPTRAYLAQCRADVGADGPAPAKEPAESQHGRREREEARARAITLEMIGERESADLRPPENVLFVCKLNPMTEDEDLRTIFSRFGPLASCDIIKDRRTGASLGYAFVEFESKEACEEAYLKMDKVLIDDRRIHVDFSQSVSKLHTDWARTRARRSPPRGSTLAARPAREPANHRYRPRSRSPARRR